MNAALDERTRAGGPLGEGVYRLLWERIVDRRLRPGQKLSDVRLSQELGVSRTPVREALQRLVRDGIVRIEPNRGFFIASFSPKDVEEIYDLRATLEAMALARSAAAFSRDELNGMLARIEEVEEHYVRAQDDADRVALALAFLEVDRAFHRVTVERADNSRLKQVMDGLWAQIAVFQQAGSFRQDWVALSCRQHRGVVAALLDGDAARAVALLREHIETVKGLVLDQLAEDAAVAPGAARTATRRGTG